MRGIRGKPPWRFCWKMSARRAHSFERAPIHPRSKLRGILGVRPVKKGDKEDYALYLEMMHRTLFYLHNEDDPAMYEKGMQLIRDFEQAREDNKLSEFNDQLNELIAEYSPLI